MTRRVYTDEQLVEAVKLSRNIKDVQLKLGFTSDSHSRRTVLQRRVETLGLDTSHFVPSRVKQRKITDDIMFSTEYATFTNTGGSTNKRVILRLVELGKPYCCDVCGISEWNNKPLRLQLDHIDGNSRNYAKENLAFLCPNCHSQTDTYSRKKQNKVL